MEEQILIRITGQDRPGLIASVMTILAKYNAHIFDIGQADIHRQFNIEVQFVKSVNYTFEQSL